MKKRYKQRKKHWFLIAYKFKTKDGGDGYGSRVIAKESMNIPNDNLTKIKNFVKGDSEDYEKVILGSISYLGHMTEKEFYDEPKK